jgi:hypothetical protein
MDISVIDDIYKSHNIYKAIFICNETKFDDYLQALKTNDYPLCLITDVESLNNDSSRILFVSRKDIDYLELILHKINCEQFSLLINIDCESHIAALGDIPTIFI